MSYYSRPEPTVQSIGSKIRTRIAEELRNLSPDNAQLRRELEQVRRQQEQENNRLTQQMQQQSRAAQTALNNARTQYNNQINNLNHRMNDADIRHAAQLNDAKNQMSSKIRELDAQVKQREYLQQQRIDAMNRQHANQLNQLRSDFKAENQAIRSEITQTRTDMRRNLEKLRNQTDRKISAQKEEMQRTIKQESNRLEGEISEVDRKVTSLAQKIKAKDKGDRELAEYWSQEAARLVAQIKENYKEQLLDQKRLSDLELQIRLANDDIKGGQYQSSLTAGRNAFFNALDMKQELAEAEIEWNYWFNVVRSRESQLLQELEDAENRIYEVETDEGLVTYDNGIDYWTSGQLTTFKEELAKLRNSIRNLDPKTSKELQDDEKAIRSLREQLALIENAAQINVAMSVSRYEIAVQIAEILGSDYQMEDADGEFFAREDREEYHAYFRNIVTGDRAAVIITPIPDETGIVTNHIDVLIGNADNNPVTRDRMANAVATNLREHGVEGCHLPCSGRFGDRTLQEVDRVGNIQAVENGDEKARASVPGQDLRNTNDVSRVNRKRKGNYR